MKNFISALLKLFWLPFRFLMDNPVIYSGKRIKIVGFGVFAALECLFISLCFLCLLYLKGIDLEIIHPFELIMCSLSIWLGAKLFHWFSLGRKFFQDPMKYIFETGFYLQGGIIGIVLWLIMLSQINNVSLSMLMDGFCWGALLGQVIGRLGCFNYGCCFGKPTNCSVSIHYTNSDSKILRWKPELHGRKIHPTQLYSSGLNLLMFIIVTWLLFQPIPNGLITIIFFLWHGITRIIVEQLRFDIIHDEGRNWITFKTALCFMLGLIPAFFVLKRIDPEFLVATPLALSHTIPNFFQYVSHDIYLMGTLFLAAGLIFLGYGIHGEKLGTFPFYQNEAPEEESVYELSDNL